MAYGRRGLLYLAFLVMATAQDAAGPASLAGRAVDAGGLPVAGAVIELAEVGRTAISGSDGTFLFDGVGAGTVTVSVQSEGHYAAQIYQVALIAGERVSLEIELIERAVIEESIVVTGTGTEYLLSAAPVRTELVSREMIDRQVKTTLSEALTSTIPGIRIEMNCQNCGYTQLRMNGLAGAYTQILEDGLPNYSGVAAVYGLEQIPTAFVDQIEVVKGGNAALYGPSAVAGVVNLIRREPRENRFRLEAQTGWHLGRPEQQLGAAGQLVEIPGGLSADLFYREINRVPIDRDRDGFSDLAKRRLRSGGGSLYRHFLDGRGRLTLAATHADEHRRGGSQFDRPPHETWITEQIDSQRSTGSIRWNHTPTPTTFYSVKASLSYLDRDTYYGTHFDPNAYGFTKNPLVVSDVQGGHQRGKHTILGGYQFSREYVEDVIPAYKRRTGGVFANNGIYLQDEFHLSPGLTILGGVRADKSNQLKHWVFSPRGGIRVGLTPDLTWRVSVSTGFRSPGVFDEDLHIASAGGEALLIENASDLKEERSLSFSTGIDYLGTFRGRRFNVGANLFSTDLGDNFLLVEEATEAAGFRLWRRTNGPGSYVRGIDFNGDAEITSRLSLRGGATFQVARFDQPEPQFRTFDFFRTPDRYGYVGFDLHLPAEIELLGTADFTGRMEVPHFAGYIPGDRLETSDPFAVFSFVASRRFRITERTRARLYLNAGNVSNSFQPDLDRGPNRDSAYVYGPGAMRQFVIGTTWEF